jgi:hypothetical protein
VPVPLPKLNQRVRQPEGAELGEERRAPPSEFSFGRCRSARGADRARLETSECCREARATPGSLVRPRWGTSWEPWRTGYERIALTCRTRRQLCVRKFNTAQARARQLPELVRPRWGTA